MAENRPQNREYTGMNGEAKNMRPQQSPVRGYIRTQSLERNVRTQARGQGMAEGQGPGRDRADFRSREQGRRPGASLERENIRRQGGENTGAGQGRRPGASLERENIRRQGGENAGANKNRRPGAPGEGVRRAPLSEEEYRRERARRKRARLIRRRRKVLLCMGLSGAVLLVGIVNLILYGVVSRYPKDVICKNIYIGAVNVSGMNKEEAKTAIEKQLEEDKEKTVSVKFDGKSAKGKLGEYGLKYTGVAKAVDEAMDYGKKGSLWNRFWKLRKTSKKLVFEEHLAIDREAGTAALSVCADSLAKRAKNASITKDGEELKIEKEQDGETINPEDFLTKLEKHLNDNWNHKGFSIKGKSEKEKADITSEDLASVKDELSSFSTDAGSGERIQNLKTGVEKVNGTVLMPGEVFSMEERTKPYTAENGYVLGGSYEGGKVVESYGGGICQVSTTLYNAVIYAELEVVERHPHSMLVDYVSPSRDAAIAEGELDFQFKNNYDTPVYINGGIDDSNQLYFEIYGKETREEGRTIEFESETLSTEDPGTSYEEDGELPFGQIEVVSGAHTGTEAKLWKIVYQDGGEVSREEFNTSSYQKADTIYAVGTQTDDADAAARLREAIATQDESQIYAAIGGTE